MAVQTASMYVKDLIEDNKGFDLVYVEANETVSNTLRKMKDKNISSLPVRDDNGQLASTIDVLDIVTFVYTKFAKVSLLAQESFQQMEEFANQRVWNLTNISGRNDFHTIRYDKPLQDVISMLTNPHIHRVAVVNEQKDIVGFISQSALIDFFYKNKDRLEPGLKKFLDEKLESWITSSGPVQVIHMQEFLIEAFRRIWENQISGIGVVDDEGRLVANISASDLKKLHVFPVGELIGQLYQPIKKFLNIRADIKDKVMMANIPKAEPIVVSKNDTMSTILELTSTKHIHRVFLVDEKQKPVAVISLCDILARLLEHSEI